ncbi:23 kDa integral membrane protein-like [Cimex lectularius]|uniref:Tetraspanin n=1 Tax=Cimex lectularius TaxID=79782 RepID=A0A8I6RB64_CIMLE|nr:23 kDa integral membrane protein-like [Cimex lectularius]
MCHSIKYILWGLNILCAISGLVVILIGAMAYLQGRPFNSILDGQLTIISNLFIVVGIFILLNSFLGCYGIMNGHSCMLMAYAGTLIALVLLQTVLGVLAYVYKNNLKKESSTRLEKHYENYERHKQRIDVLQQHMECCGARGKQEWKIEQLPASCCKFDKAIGKCTRENAYNVSCTSQIEKVIVKQFGHVGFTAFATMVTEVGCFIFAFILALRE